MGFGYMDALHVQFHQSHDYHQPWGTSTRKAVICGHPSVEPWKGLWITSNNSDGRREATLLQALESDRYLALFERREAEIQSPAIGKKCDSLTNIAGTAFKKLRRAIKAQGLAARDTVLHQIRINGKKARYAAELAQTSVEKPAAHFLCQAKAFQDLLGEHHDAQVTEQRMRKLLRQAHGRLAAFSLGRLIERQCERRRNVRAALPKA